MFELELGCLGRVMSIKAYLFSKKKDSYLEVFLSNYNFLFINLNELRALKEPVWIFFGSSQEKKDIEDFILEIKGLKMPIIFYVPLFLKNFEIKESDQKFFYPLDIVKFERAALNKNLFNIYEYEDIIIDSSNLVKNKQKNLSVHFTEKEVDLFKKLVEAKKIKKQEIKTDILKFSSLLQTRSLESHLSRIRKKLISIKSKISILSEKDDYVSIN